MHLSIRGRRGKGESSLTSWWKRMKKKWDDSVDRRIRERDEAELRIIEKYASYETSALLRMYDASTDKKEREEIVFAVQVRRELGGM